MPYCLWPGLAFFRLSPGSGQLCVSSGNLAPTGCTHIVVWIILLHGPTKPTSWGWMFGVGRFEHQIPEYYVASKGVWDTLESFGVLLIFHCSNSPAACLGNWSVTQLSWQVLLVKVLKGEPLRQQVQPGRSSLRWPLKNLHSFKNFKARWKKISSSKFHYKTNKIVLCF